MSDATKRWLDEDEQRVYDDPTNVHPGGNESRLMDIIDRLCSRIDKQQEVIDKLPKTADGVPVGCGSHVWWDMRHDGDFCSWSVGAIFHDRLQLGNGCCPFADQCYSTKEAAAAARAGEGK